MENVSGLLSASNGDNYRKLHTALTERGYDCGPCWLHSKAAIKLGKTLSGWIWWYAEKPPKRCATLKDIIEKNAPFDKGNVIRLIPEKHKARLEKFDTIYTTTYVGGII